MKPVPHGEPYAGKLHVRFDEGAGVSCGGAPLYSTPHCIPVSTMSRLLLTEMTRGGSVNLFELGLN